MALRCAGRTADAAAAFRMLPLRDIDPRIPTSMAMVVFGTELALHLHQAVLQLLCEPSERSRLGGNVAQELVRTECAHGSIDERKGPQTLRMHQRCAVVGGGLVS